MSINPEIDENYFARTEKNTENLFTSPICIYILVFYVVGYVTTVTLTVLMLWIFFNAERWDKMLIKMGDKQTNIYKDTKSKIFSVALTAGVLMLYILALDITAIVTLEDKIPILSNRVFDDKDLPFIVLAVDLVMVIMWTVCWILSYMPSICRYCCRYSCTKLDNKKFLLRAISTFGPIFTLVTHLPYIAIAYLNDSSYASSIFIYYTVVAFVIFGSLEFTYGTFLQAIHTKKEFTQNGCNESNDDETVRASLINRGDDDSQFPTFPICLTAKNKKCIWVSIGIFFVLLVLLLIGITTAALVVVPVSRTFSDAPNRLLGFYETVVVIAGAFLAYKSFFNKKPTLETAIKKGNPQLAYQRNGGNTNGNDLTEDQKVAAFYDHVVDIVVKYNPTDMHESERN